MVTSKYVKLLQYQKISIYGHTPTTKVVGVLLL